VTHGFSEIAGGCGKKLWIEPQGRFRQNTAQWVRTGAGGQKIETKLPQKRWNWERLGDKEEKKNFQIKKRTRGEK
jgi:hypothetical protein